MTRVATGGLAFTIASGMLAGALGVASAEERLKDYIYNPDGTYHEKSLTSREQLRGTAFIEGSLGGGYNVSTGDSAVLYGLRGSYGRKLGTNFHLQTDLNYIASSTGVDQANATVHVATRFPKEFALGVFGQFGLVGVDGVNQTSFGVEGLTYLGEKTVFGRVGYGTTVVGSKSYDNFFVDIGARHYFNDNAAFQAEGGYAGDIVQARLTGLYRLPDSQNTLSLTTTYGAEIDNPGEGVVTALAAWRYSFSSNTLKEEEHEGIIWTTVR